MGKWKGKANQITMTKAVLPTVRSLSIDKRNKKIIQDYQTAMNNGELSLSVIRKLAKKHKLKQRQVYNIINKTNL